MTSFTTTWTCRARRAVRRRTPHRPHRRRHGGSTTTVVDVRPANPDSAADVEHAAATYVEQRGDTIEVIAPTSKGWFGRNPRLDIRAVVPPRSRVDVDVKSADVQLAGELGRVSVVLGVR